MIKTLKKVQQQNKEPIKQFKAVQDAIPLVQVYEDGIFLVQKSKGKYNNTFSAVFRLQDISYLTASSEVQRDIFLKWSAVLNVLEPGSDNKITIMKRRLTESNLQQFLFHNKNPQYEHLQKEYNEMLLKKSTQGNGMIQELYLTVSVNKRDFKAAHVFFQRMESTLQTQLGRMETSCQRLSSEERLRLLHDVYRVGKEEEAPFDMSQSLKTGSSAKNYLAPDSFEFKDDYFRMGDMFGRALVIHSYPAFLRDTIVSDLCELDQPLIWSMDIIPTPMDEAMQIAESKATAAEANIVKWFRKQHANKNYTDIPPYDLERQREQAREYLKDLGERDQHLMYAVITIVHFAQSKQDLDTGTERLVSDARTSQCRLDVLRWQQLDGLNTALPFGVRKIEDFMTLTTEGVAGFMPFRSSERQDPGGTYYGQNRTSQNLILINPKSLKSANRTILGCPGGGKSFLVKRTLLSDVLATSDAKHEFLIIDPEHEYGPLVNELGGEVLRISADSSTYINPLWVSAGYRRDDENPITVKTDFMTGLFGRILAPVTLTAGQKSIIARCTSACLDDYVRHNCEGDAPTLVDFQHILEEQPEEDARELALALEMFTTGPMNVFAHSSNVDMDNRILCFDINDMGDNIKGLGMLILLDHIWNRVVRNRARGISTSIICDEFYLMFTDEYSASFFYKGWKRGRKYDAVFTAITQNVEDFLRAPESRAILANSELLILLKQAPTDLEPLADMLNLSETQQDILSFAEAGCGLLKVDKAIIPFVDSVPKDTRIYQLLSTTPGESIMDTSSEGEQDA